MVAASAFALASSNAFAIVGGGAAAGAEGIGRSVVIVTGSRGGPGGDCGTIYKTRADVAGLPLAKAKVPHQ